MNTHEALQQAIRAIQEGDRSSGKRLLAEILRADPKNIQAWLWMYEVADTDAQRRDCLLRVLSIDPQNRVAIAGLARLREPTSAGTLFQDRTSDPRDVTSSADKTDAPGEAERKRGYRNIMLAGVMTFTMMCGLVLLLVTVTTIIPRAQERMQPTPEPVLYTATLWCPPCEQADTLVILWEKVGDGVSRGGKVGELPHNTAVSILAKEWSEPEGRTYFKITAHGETGWVPETFIKE